MEPKIIKVNKSNYGISYIIKCFNCNKHFKVKKSELEKGRYKYYCSMKCRSEAKTEKIKCLICNKEVIRSKASKSKYCSIKCVGKFHTRKKSKEHKAKIARAHIGMKASKETREKLSKGKIEFLKKNPEKHINRILAKKGYITSIERKMKDLLTQLKIDFEYNFRIDRYYVDFALLDKKLVIECDGEYWHKGNEKNDLKRQKEIEKKEWRVLRFWGNEINNEIDKCRETIKAYI